MTLSEELKWRGFVNQTTFKDIADLDKQKLNFYWGVDPSADSMQVGNLAAAMMVRHFIDYGYGAYLLVGGATGLIGDPDGKASERELINKEQVEANKKALSAQYEKVFGGQQFKIVDNYDWFKDMGYLEFLREIGKHVPMRQMLGREFVQSRLSESGSGISYAEFSYSLIQGYDYYYLHKNEGVNLQVCGADQWGNSVTGVDLIRRLTGDETHVWSSPLIINKQTGVKFGKSEAGAVWLDPNKTSPTAFYQFWITTPDDSVEELLKIYTLLNQEEINQLMEQHKTDPKQRAAQKRLAQEVTKLVHGEQQTNIAEQITAYLTGEQSIGEASGEILEAIRKEVPAKQVAEGSSVVQALAETGLASSNSQARQLIEDGGVSINGETVRRTNFESSDFMSGRLLLRRGKAFKDSALIEQT